MQLEDIRGFIESNKDNQEVQEFLGEIAKTNTNTNINVAEYLESEEGKRLLQPKLDGYFSKGLETWKNNNLDKLLEEKIKERYPDKSEKDIELEKLRIEIESIRSEALKKELTNKALLIADEKALPKGVIDYFIGEDEESTLKNLQVLEEVFANHIDKQVTERLKTTSNIPPKSNGGGSDKLSLEDVNTMTPEQINKHWDSIIK